jgi:hypothetical protein
MGAPMGNTNAAGNHVRKSTKAKYITFNPRKGTAKWNKKSKSTKSKKAIKKSWSTPNK